ncbi:hypothetical protein B0A49_13559, partial [Cryomyces minteri]
SGLESHGANSSVVKSAADYGEVLHTVVRFLTDLHATSAIFRDFEISSDYVQELLAVLYPVIVSSDSVSAETELNSRDSTLTFEGQDVVIRPHSKATTTALSAAKNTNQKAVQDQQDNLAYIMSSYDKLDKMLRRPCGLLEEDEASCRWQLDETEGRNRMRMRILPDRSTQQHVFHPKASTSGKTTPSKLKIDTSLAGASTIEVAGMTPSATESVFGISRQISRVTSPGLLDETGQDTPVPEEDFEMVADPREDDGFEDKNRKVMRSLERGDQVQNLCNVSRIVGLEAYEGLLVVGKDHLYLQDNFFQRSDGEIISVAQAPAEERDPYLQMISGRETKIRRTQHSSGEQSAWNWAWEDVISISKRRFLFRDVAIEVFFTDGRSYLLTTISPT